MSDLSQIFREGAKVVISPDKMRAWVSLPAPTKGVQYTEEAVARWLPEKGVVYGADAEMIRKAVASKKYDDLLEVARGKAPVAAAPGSYTLKIEKKPFTGLRAIGDGSLVYDDLSFLQEAQAGDILAEVVPATPAQNGMTVTGEEIAPRSSSDTGRELTGSGYEITDDGRYYRAPGLSHVSFVNDQLVVVPLQKLAALSEEDGPLSFDGNVLVTGDVARGAKLNASGSVYVAGRTVSAEITAGNNILLCQGMRNEGGHGKAEAKGHVWGQFFESCTIKAGGDVHANHIMGCEVTAKGRASVLGGRATVGSTTLYAKNGVVTGTVQGHSTIGAGLDREFIDRYESVNKKTDRLGIDIQALQQNITAHERVNRTKPDKGKNDPAYKEMVAKRDQALGVLNILNNERTRLKRTMDQATAVAIIVRDTAEAGTVITIDTYTMNVLTTMKRTRFRRRGDAVEATAIGG